MQAWWIVVDNPDLRDVFHILHYEGHPSLWYLILWSVGRFTSSLVALKLVNAAIVIPIFMLIGLASPFSRLEKALLLLGYFVIFTFTVSSRVYSLALLLTVAYACLRSAPVRRDWGCAALLGLIANTTAFGTILAAALTVEFALYETPGKRRDLAAFRAALPMLALVALGAGAALLTAWPAADKSVDIDAAAAIGFSFQRLLTFIIAVFMLVFVPVPQPWWHPLPFSTVAQTATLMLLVIVAIWRLGRRGWGDGLILWITIIGTVAFLYRFMSHYGARHVGTVFLAFLVVIWLRRRGDTGVGRVALALLVLNAIGGIHAAAEAWVVPMSNAGPVARYLEAQGLDEDFVFTNQRDGAPLAGMLDKPVFFPQCRCFRRYMDWSNKEDGYDPHQEFAILREALDTRGRRESIVVFNAPLDDEQLDEAREAGFTIEKLTSFTGALVTQEDYWLYRAKIAGP